MAAFTDDFNRADSTNLGANWVEVSGDWSIVSNQLSSGSAGGTIILRAAGAMATNDHYAQVTIAATTAASHGVWCRGNSNISQGYLWRNDGTSWNLFSVVGGSFTSIGSFAGAAANGDVAKVQAVGSTIKGFVNGVQRVSVTDTNVPTGTSVGLRSESTSALRFDDFSAADVTTGVTGDAALSSTAALSAAGVRGAAGASALAATAPLSASGVRASAGTAGLAATAGLTADGIRAAAGTAGLTATAALAADSTVGASGSAELTVAADLAAAGQRTAVGDATLSAGSALSAAGQRGTATTADLAAMAALGAQGQIGRSGDTALDATAALAAAGVTVLTGNAALAATATLTASGTTSGSGDDIDVTIGSPYGRRSTRAPQGRWKTGGPDGGWEVEGPWI